MKSKLSLVLMATLFATAVWAGAKYKSIEKLVTTAGTRVPLSATDLYSSQVRIKARSNNSGIVYIGGSDVASTNGYHLAANAEVLLGDLMREHGNEAINLKDVYVDAATNGDGVRVIYVYSRYKGSEPKDQ